MAKTIAEDWAAARQRLRVAGHGNSLAEVRARRAGLEAAINPKVRDGRSLRATGRTEQMNFKARPLIRKALLQHVGRGGISLWLEEAIVAKLRSEGVDGIF